MSEDQEPRTWAHVRELLEARISHAESTFERALAGLKELLLTRLNAAAAALDLAETNARIDAQNLRTAKILSDKQQNEWRGSLADLTAKFTQMTMPKSEIENEFTAVRATIDRDFSAVRTLVEKLDQRVKVLELGESRVLGSASTHVTDEERKRWRIERVVAVIAILIAIAVPLLLFWLRR